MPIEVYCPNPSCGKVHLVKDKYAGLRGKCPSCSSWMIIPPLTPVARVEPKTDRDAEVADHALELAAEDKSRQQTRWPAILFLLFGIVSLLAISTTPFLDGAVYQGEKGKGIRDDLRDYVMAVPAGGAVIALLALMGGLVGKRFGFSSLFLVYMTTLLSAGILFLALFSFREEWRLYAKYSDSVAELQGKGRVDAVDVSMGTYLWVAAGGAIAACVSFVLAAVFMHRRSWCRLVAFFFLGGVATLGAVWVYRVELHIAGLEKYLPF